MEAVVAPIKSFVVERKRWLRGRPEAGFSFLLDSANRRCCLGFYASACGVTDEMLLAWSNPGVLKDVIGDNYPEQMGWLIESRAGKTIPSKAGYALMEMNDDSLLGDDDKEKRVREGFAKQGIEVQFV